MAQKSVTATTSFQPASALRHPHAQSFLASAGPRKLIVRRRARELLASSTHHILNCQHGIKLSGDFTPGRDGDRRLVTLIHGWEGCSTSSYVLSAASHFYAQGYSVFRLNLRDHGDSHHLNEELFHSCRIEEVLDAVAEIQRLFPHQENYLAGFSLGGNFALRIAAQHKRDAIQLNRVVGVCPVIDPWNAMHCIEDALLAYRYYFTRKWKKSLRKKLLHFPHYDFEPVMDKARSLKDLNAYFVPNHTPFETPEDYFNGYGVTGVALKDLAVPTHIVTSADDPIVPTADLGKIDAASNIHIEVQTYGGHCGFLQDFRFNSWIDQRLCELFDG